MSKEAAEQHFAIVLDGQLITVPSIDFTQYPEGIDASTGSEISGGFTLTSAQELASELQSGALPIRLDLISRSQVSATLGKQALQQALVALLVGFVVVCLFLLTFYRVLGVIAVGGLLIYGIYFFALIKLIPITMTLPGIAGLVLTIGVAADANIVIFERVKEEIRSGRSVVAGIATGYRKGFAAIVDANVVTFMTAFILFALATAEVKGFAFTLGIGMLVSLFTAVLATQAALGVMSTTGVVTHPRALGAEKQAKRWTFDFMGRSKWFFSLSGTILLIGALAIGARGINLGIDFKAGTRIQTGFEQAVTTTKINEELNKLGVHGSQIQRFSNASVGGVGYQISTRTLHPEQLEQGRIGPAERVRPQTLLREIDRADVRPVGGEERDHRDHRLAAGDQRIYRAALRVEVRGPGADRVDARPPDHRGRLRPDGAGSDDGNSRRAAERSSAIRSTTRSSSSTESERTCHECRAPRSRRS